MTVAARIANCRVSSQPAALLVPAVRVSRGVLLLPTRRIAAWLFLEGVLRVSQSRRFLPFPRHPLFPLSSCWCHLQRRGVPAGGAAGEGCQAGPCSHRHRHRHCRAPGFVCASLLPGPATVAASRRPVSQLGLLVCRMAGASVLRRTGVKRDTRRALSTSSL